jgi:hypothetical protein
MLIALAGTTTTIRKEIKTPFKTLYKSTRVKECAKVSNK